MGMIEIAEKHRGGGFGRAINDLVRDLPHCDFEKLRFQLTNEIMELQLLKSEGAK